VLNSLSLMLTHVHSCIARKLPSTVLARTNAAIRGLANPSLHSRSITTPSEIIVEIACNAILMSSDFVLPMFPNITYLV
jgi:hypothetical protein